MPDLTSAPLLHLQHEHKFAELFDAEAGLRFEASGVCAQNGYFYVIFDSLPHVAQIETKLPLHTAARRWFRQRGDDAGYEDITYDEKTKRFYLMIEAALFAPGVYKARIEEYDENFQYLESQWLDFELPSENKGFEGLSWMTRDGQDYVLAACEGNKCKAGALGRVPGGGRIHVFQKSAKQWEHLGKIKIPKAVQFEDYSGLDILDDKVVVVSQATSALWIGTLHPHAWTFTDDGQVYHFPKNEKGKVIYGNVEGVSWMSPTQVVVVSDKFKAAQQPKRCEAKDQSIHIFDLAASG